MQEGDQQQQWYDERSRTKADLMATGKDTAGVVGVHFRIQVSINSLARHEYIRSLQTGHVASAPSSSEKASRLLSSARVMNLSVANC
jgi:hypothetical protein